MIGTDFGKDSSEESKRDSLGSLEDTLLQLMKQRKNEQDNLGDLLEAEDVELANIRSRHHRSRQHSKRINNLGDLSASENENTNTLHQNEEMSLKRHVSVRSQLQYQSLLSSSQSLTFQRDSHIYFHLQEYIDSQGDLENDRDTVKDPRPQQKEYVISTLKQDKQGQIAHRISKKDEEWGEIEKEILKVGKIPIKVQFNELGENSTVQEAIISAICQINNFLSINSINLHLLDDPDMYDMYLAKKNGERKSLPALYPLDKIQKFSKSNVTLVSRSKYNIVRLHKNSTEGKTKQFKQGIPVIREVKESLISIMSQKSIDGASNQQDLTKSKQSFNNTDSVKLNPPFENHQANDSKSILSTIIVQQTKNGHEERDTEDTQNNSPSKCFPFFCCVGRNSSKPSSSKKNNNTSDSKKKQMPTVKS